MFAIASLQVRIVANANWVDYLIIGLYFAVTLGIGFALRTRMRSSEDFFLSGRSLPSWGLPHSCLACSGTVQPPGGFWGLLIGTIVSIVLWVGEQFMHLFSLGSSEGSSMWRALIAFVVCFLITVTVSLFTERKTDGELKGLVYGLTQRVQVSETVWYKRPLVLAGVAIGIFVVLNIAFF